MPELSIESWIICENLLVPTLAKIGFKCVDLPRALQLGGVLYCRGVSLALFLYINEQAHPYCQADCDLR